MGSEVSRGAGKGNLPELLFYKQAECVLQELRGKTQRQGRLKTCVLCCNI